jgi:hypothetical protein
MKATATENDKATNVSMQEEFGLAPVVVLTGWSGQIEK